jgi:hypothetical protein
MPRRLALRLSIPAALAVALVLPAAADVVTTTDGLVLEGTVVKGADGSLTVTTADGSVVLQASRVASTTPGDGPRAKAAREAAALPATDVEGHYRLAVRFEANGLRDLAKAEYETVLRVDPEHPAARRALGFEKVDGEWLPLAEARRRRGLVLFGGRWLVPAEAEAAARSAKPASTKDVALVTAMRHAASPETAIARAGSAKVETAAPEARLEAATALLLDRDPKVRAWSATHLGVLGDERSLRALLTSAVRDPSADVRKAAVEAAASFGHDDTAIPLVRALDSSHPGIVANAARGLAMLGDTRGIAYLVKKIVTHGSSSRVYLEVLNQVSYIRDYDVEVAQSSNIADPIIGIVQEGVVLDVKVLDASIEKTVVETVLVDSFNALARANVRDAAGVAAWWREHGSTVPRFPEKPASNRKGRAAPKN